MSLASDYAAAQLDAANKKDEATALAPPSFVGPNGRADVTEHGNLKLTRTAGDFEIPPQAALAFAAWVVQTFGG